MTSSVTVSRPAASTARRLAHKDSRQWSSATDKATVCAIGSRSCRPPRISPWPWRGLVAWMKRLMSGVEGSVDEWLNDEFIPIGREQVLGFKRMISKVQRELRCTLNRILDPGSGQVLSAGLARSGLSAEELRWILATPTQA